MSVNERAAQERRRLLTDFPYFCEKFIKIINKDGEMVPLVLRPYQIRLWRLILKMIAEGRPVRIIVLKSRQLGFSTMMQAYLLWRTITNPYSGSLTVAHDDKASTELFGKIEFAYENLPEWFYKDLENAKNTAIKGKKLSFGKPLNSRFFVDTAGNKNVGRSMTFQRAHLSEVAFWENMDMKLYGLMQALGKRAGSECILESTANGMGGPHHRLWVRACSGESMWEPFFVGWTEDPDCRMKPHADFKRTPDEKELARRYDLDDEQLQWRRYTIEDECNGDIELFRQEYPIEPDEAFIVSGNPYFGPRVIKEVFKQVCEPQKWGRIELINGSPTFVGNHQEGVQVSGEFINDGTPLRTPGGAPNPNAPWWIWRDPVPEHGYAMGADVAGGTGKDFSAAHLLDLATEEYAATFQGKLDPDEFAHQLRWMGLTYNVALLAPEKNNEGRHTVLMLLKQLFYPRIFFHQHVEEWSGGVKTSYGWTTSTKTRPTMLSQFAAGLRERSPKLYCERTAHELTSFVRVDTVKLAEAAEGANDDMVISAGITNSSEVRAFAAFVDLSEFQTQKVVL